jgi:hypothetical protein
MKMLSSPIESSNQHEVTMGNHKKKIEIGQQIRIHPKSP